MHGLELLESYNLLSPAPHNTATEGSLGLPKPPKWAGEVRKGDAGIGWKACIHHFLSSLFITLRVLHRSSIRGGFRLPENAQGLPWVVSVSLSSYQGTGSRKRHQPLGRPWAFSTAGGDV